MARLWVRIIKDHKISSQLTLPCTNQINDALREGCKQLDVPVPIWLPKHEKEYASFRRTAFTADNFMESTDFDRLEIEYLDDTGVKRKSNDPRNQF